LRAPAACLLSLLLVACASRSQPAAKAPRPAGGAAANAPSEPALLIRGARLFDGERLGPARDVLVRGARIAEVGSGLAAPATTEIVDARGLVLLPALIDAHVHAFSTEALQQSAALGVTTVLDMGVTATSVTAGLKQQASRVDSGLADIRFAGYAVTCPRGHGTEYPGPPVPTVSAPADAEPFVARLVEEGVDYIKIIYTAGLDLPPEVAARAFPSISKETMAAAVAAAHRHGKLAVAHINARRGARDAVDAGVDALVHLFNDKMPEPDFGATAAAHHLFVVPTLSAIHCGAAAGAELAAEPELAPFLPTDVAQRLQRSSRSPKVIPCDDHFAEAAVRSLVEAGVPVLAGTDAPNPGTSYGVSVHGELERLVHAGLTPAAALAAATSVPARVFGLDDRGRIAPGLRADLLLVRGDPSADIRATRAIVAVWKEGRRIDREALRKEVARDQAQAKAQLAQPPPAGSEPGLVSDFESGRPEARFGSGWSITTDEVRGGVSKATMAVVAGGAAGTSHALRVTGSVVAGSTFPWAGVIFAPGPRPFAAANLRSKRALAFQARGDGGNYSVLVFTGAGGFMPSVQTFVAPKRWERHRLAFAEFGTDGRDISGIAFVATTPGAFRLEIDEVELTP
jgi:imidazolonepropionase-like amidohydrolase